MIIKWLLCTQVVVDWLEKNAQSNLGRYPEKISYFADSVTWENTLHHLKQETNDGRMVTKMVCKNMHSISVYPEPEVGVAN